MMMNSNSLIKSCVSVPGICMLLTCFSVNSATYDTSKEQQLNNEFQSETLLGNILFKNEYSLQQESSKQRHKYIEALELIKNKNYSNAIY